MNNGYTACVLGQIAIAPRGAFFGGTAMSTVNRRNFIKLGAASAATLTLAGQFTTAFAAGSDKLRVGQIGCGGRGQHDAGATLAASKNIELVALGDLFEDRLKGHL